MLKDCRPTDGNCNGSAKSCSIVRPIYTACEPDVTLLICQKVFDIISYALFYYMKTFGTENQKACNNVIITNRFIRRTVNRKSTFEQI